LLLMDEDDVFALRASEMAAFASLRIKAFFGTTENAVKTYLGERACSVLGERARCLNYGGN
jgi:hypothetical protein